MLRRTISSRTILKRVHQMDMPIFQRLFCSHSGVPIRCDVQHSSQQPKKWFLSSFFQDFICSFLICGLSISTLTTKIGNFNEKKTSQTLGTKEIHHGSEKKRRTFRGRVVDSTFVPMNYVVERRHVPCSFLNGSCFFGHVHFSNVESLKSQQHDARTTNAN